MKNINCKKIIIPVLLGLLLPSLSAVAESTIDSLSGQNVQTTGGGNAGADKIASGMTANPGGVIDYTQTNNSLGREQKAADSAASAGTGKGIAIGTGAALMARGIPMLASPFPSVVATGAALIAKAGLEFAQAAADNGSQKANKAQENLLRSENGQGESAASAMEAGKKEVTDQVAQTVGQNPDLAKLLGDKGVNAQDFANQLASGQLSSPESVLAATGNAGSVDSAALAQGVAAAGSPGGLPDLGSARAIQEDSQKDTASASAGGGGGGSSGGNGGGNSAGAGLAGQGAGGLSGDGPGKAANGIAQALSGAGAKGAAAAAELVKNASEGDLASMLAGFMGMGGAEKESDATGNKLVLDRKELEKKGILKSSGKPTIFALAARNFRSFKKWRKNREVVAAR